MIFWNIGVVGIVLVFGIGVILFIGSLVGFLIWVIMIFGNLEVILIILVVVFLNVILKLKKCVVFEWRLFFLIWKWVSFCIFFFLCYL